MVSGRSSGAITNLSPCTQWRWLLASASPSHDVTYPFSDKRNHTPDDHCLERLYPLKSTGRDYFRCSEKRTVDSIIESKATVPYYRGQHWTLLNVEHSYVYSSISRFIDSAVGGTPSLSDDFVHSWCILFFLTQVIADAYWITLFNNPAVDTFHKISSFKAVQPPGGKSSWSLTKDLRWSCYHQYLI